MLEPVLEWDSLVEGRTFPAVSFTLDDAWVDAYLAATGESHPLYAPGAFAPPTMTTLVRQVKASLGGRWPSGTLQLDHRVEMRRPVRRGEALTLDVTIGRIETRGGRPCFEMRSRVRDAAGAVVVDQRSRSMWGGAMPAGAQPRNPSAPTSAPAPASDGPSGPVAPGTARVSDEGDGERLGPLTAHYPLASLRAYGELAGALDPIHVDPEFGRGTRFGVNIVQGRLAMTLVSRLMLERHGADWLARGGFDLRFSKPIRVGEPVLARARAIACRPQCHEVWCESPAGVRVIEGQAWLGQA